jgi:hypothetical protein
VIGISWDAYHFSKTYIDYLLEFRSIRHQRSSRLKRRDACEFGELLYKM